MTSTEKLIAHNSKLATPCDYGMHDLGPQIDGYDLIGYSVRAFVSSRPPRGDKTITAAMNGLMTALEALGYAVEREGLACDLHGCSRMVLGKRIDRKEPS